MPLSSRPPADIESVVDLEDSGIQYSEEDRQLLDSIRAANSTQSHEATNRPETPKSLYKHLMREAEAEGYSLYQVLATDYLWEQLYQSSRWADVASRNNNRIALLEMLLKHEINCGKFDGKQNRIARIQKTIKELQA